MPDHSMQDACTPCACSAVQLHSSGWMPVCVPCLFARAEGIRTFLHHGKLQQHLPANLRAWSTIPHSVVPTGCIPLCRQSCSHTTRQLLSPA